MNYRGLGICEWSLPTPMRGPTVCRVVKDFGMEAVELDLGLVEENFPLANPYVIDAYKEARSQYGVTYTGIAVNLTDFYPMTAPLSDPGRELVEYAIKKAIDTASELDIPLIHVPSFFKSHVSTDEDMMNTADCFRRSCDYAADKNVLVCTENYMDTSMQLQLLELVDKSNFKVYFDTQNYQVNGLYTPDLIKPIFEYIAEVHVKDGYQQLSTHLIGTGGSDVFKTLEVLEECGYTGWLLMENYFSKAPLCKIGDDPFAIMKKDLDILIGWLDKR